MVLKTPEPVCFAEIITNMLRGKWSIHILHTLRLQGALNFNSLHRSISGISTKVLNEQLGYLTVAGVLQRVPTNNPRQEVIYSFTEQGRELCVVLDTLDELARRWQTPQMTMEISHQDS
ncbi:winged helix-turn-helix transcriptional regulator [Acinetobacter sp. GN11]